MIVYSYDENGRYIGQRECQLDPLETEIRDEPVYIKPAYSTSIEPPEFKDGFDIVWNGESWEYQEIPKPEEPEPYTPSPQEIRKYEIEARLNELSQDFIQVSLGAELTDIEDRKEEFRTLHNKLRQLLGKEPRVYKE